MRTSVCLHSLTIYFPSLVATLVVLLPARVHAGDVFITSLNGLEIWTADGPEPPSLDDEFQTRILQFRTTDPRGSIVTFDGIRIEGGLRQVWIDSFGAPQPTPTQYDWDLNVKGADFLRTMDSHYLVPKGSAVLPRCSGTCGYTLTESNDFSIFTPIEGSDDLRDNVAIGLGSIFHEDPLDAFFLANELQSNQLDFAQLVISCAAAARGGVHFSGGILGSKFEPAYFDQVQITCVPEPAMISALLSCSALLLNVRRRLRRSNAVSFNG